jgi:hypothetical protein
VWAVNGTIQTSDVRDKENLGDPEDAVLRAIARVKIYKYNWKSDEKKRIQYGPMVQDIMAEFRKEGLDPMEYGLIEGDEETRYGLHYEQFNLLRMEAMRLGYLCSQG